MIAWQMNVGAEWQCPVLPEGRGLRGRRSLLTNRFDEPQCTADVAEVGYGNQASDQAAAEQIEHDLRFGPLGAQFFFRADSGPVTFVVAAAPGETCSVQQGCSSRFAFTIDFGKPDFARRRRAAVRADIMWGSTIGNRFAQSTSKLPGVAVLGGNRHARLAMRRGFFSRRVLDKQLQRPLAG